MTMRILLACAAFPPNGKGGGPASSELIAMGLANLGNTVRVLTVSGEQSTQRRDGFEIKTLRSLNVHWDYWKNNPAWRKLFKPWWAVSRKRRNPPKIPPPDRNSPWPWKC